MASYLYGRCLPESLRNSFDITLTRFLYAYKMFLRALLEKLAAKFEIEYQEAWAIPVSPLPPTLLLLPTRIVHSAVQSIILIHGVCIPLSDASLEPATAIKPF